MSHIPSPKAVLEVLHGAQAAQAAGCHDADAGAQRLTLLHAVRCQDHSVACIVDSAHDISAFSTVGVLRKCASSHTVGALQA